VSDYLKKLIVERAAVLFRAATSLPLFCLVLLLVLPPK
jgi:hypothetical protein